MKYDIKKEWPNLLAMVLPFIYLAYIWNQMPETIPIHWNASGEIDGYGNKNTLILLPFILPGFVYLLMTTLPQIDPKNKILRNPRKFMKLKTLMVFLMAVIATFIMYSSYQGKDGSPDAIFALVGILFAVLGNFMSTVKPNYFIGIRTPWTIENEIVWKKTHQMGGKIWFIGGIILTIGPFLIPAAYGVTLLLSITAIITIIPTVYSYKLYKKLQS